MRHYLDYMYDKHITNKQPPDWAAYEAEVMKYVNSEKPSYEAVSYKTLLALQAKLLVNAFSVRWVAWALVRVWSAAVIIYALWQATQLL